MRYSKIDVISFVRRIQYAQREYASSMLGARLTGTKRIEYASTHRSRSSVLPRMDTGTPSTESSGERTRRRQTHQKSRNGCDRCKLRHRKCDEVHPQCGTCRRSGSSCSFAPARHAAATATDSASERHALAINDMRLLHHWLKGDPEFFEDHDRQTAKRDQDHQMEMAFSHPYLLHAILAIAALDLFHHHPTNLSYYEQASSHHLAALRYGRPNITQSSSEHSEPMWCFSAFMALYSFVEPPLRLLVPQHESSFDCLRDLLFAFGMGRGIISVMAANKCNLGDVDKANDTKWPDETEEVMPTLDADFPQRRALAVLVEEHCDPPTAEKVNVAVTKLFAIISLLRRRPKKHSSARMIQTWAMHVDKELYAMWERRHPVGLVILAHYAVLVHSRSNIWFFERWPRMIMEFVQMQLSDEWKAYVEWPQRVIAQTAHEGRGMDLASRENPDT